MLTELSSLLIALLLFLSPVSFSSEKIPDFSPDCRVTSATASFIAVSSLDGSTYDPILPHRQEIQECSIAPTIIPAANTSRIALVERAPPT
jgi:hypothetical protein